MNGVNGLREKCFRMLVYCCGRPERAGETIACREDVMKSTERGGEKRGGKYGRDFRHPPAERGLSLEVPQTSHHSAPK